MQNIIEETNLSLRYFVPSLEYLSSHKYYPETNTIISLPPFSSWVLVDGKWEAPVPYPTDGKVYNWNEDLGNWMEI